MSHIDGYIQKLEGDDMEASGLLTKLQRMCAVINYALHELKWSHDPSKQTACDDTSYRLNRCIKNLTRNKSSKEIECMHERSEAHLQYADEYKKFCNLEEPKLNPSSRKQQHQQSKSTCTCALLACCNTTLR